MERMCISTTWRVSRQVQVPWSLRPITTDTLQSVELPERLSLGVERCKGNANRGDFSDKPKCISCASELNGLSGQL